MDVDGGGPSAKVAKLLPKGLAATRRWRKQPSKESFGSGTSSDDGPRGRSPHSREALYVDGASDSMASARAQFDDPLEEDQEEEDGNVTPVIGGSDHEV
jgi:hypothetical protein